MLARSTVLSRRISGSLTRSRSPARPRGPGRDGQCACSRVGELRVGHSIESSQDIERHEALEAIERFPRGNDIGCSIAYILGVFSIRVAQNLFILCYFRLRRVLQNGLFCGLISCQSVPSMNRVIGQVLLVS
jgi:hypothetical protein